MGFLNTLVEQNLLKAKGAGLWVVSCILFALPSQAYSSNYEEPVIITESWNVGQGVEKLFQTPLGAVYHFKASEFNELSTNKTSLYSLQINLFKNVKKPRRPRRFIIMDFHIRLYPALDSIKDPRLRFGVTRSLNYIDNINYSSDLNGLALFDNASGSGFQAPGRSSLKWDKQYPWCLLSGKRYLPGYEVLSYRMIHDTYQNKVYSINCNGAKNISLHCEVPNSSGSVRSLGLYLYITPREKRKREYRRTYLEISNPQVILTDDPEYVRNLSPVKMIKYPYNGYAMIRDEKIIKTIERKNPDSVYATGMRLLEGEDLVEGVEKLEKAAKKNHIFAMYQLGICYWRGIGVERSFAKARKWLQKAMKYGLPDAYALYSQICFKTSNKPFLSNQAVEAVTRSKYYPEGNLPQIKSDNMFINLMFFAKDRNCGWFWGQFGPKLRFWAIAGMNNREYYRDCVPDVKNKNKAAMFLRNKRRISSGPYVKHIDWRYVSDGCGITSDNFLNEINKSKYAPSMLLAGRLISALTPAADGTIPPNFLSLPGDRKWSTEKALRLASELFDAGAKLGNKDCLAEALLCRLRLGKLADKDLSPEIDYKLTGHPLYEILKFIRKNPDFPGVKNFLNRRFLAAEEAWKKDGSPQSAFLLGAEILYQYFHYGFTTSAYRMMHEDVADLKFAYEQLNKAVRANIVSAAYLSGKLYLDGYRTSFKAQTSGNQSIGRHLIARAAKAGHIKARYFLVKHEFDNSNYFKVDWLRMLEPARGANDPDAWYLSAGILRRQLVKRYDLNNKVIAVYKKAGQLGAKRAWYDLGMMYYKDNNRKTREDSRRLASVCWRKFIEIDNFDRAQDYSDFFWPEQPVPEVFYLDQNGDVAPAGCSKRSMSKKKIQSYIKQY